MLQLSNREIRARFQPYADLLVNSVAEAVATTLDIEPEHVAVDVTVRIPLDDDSLLQVSSSKPLGRKATRDAE